MKKYFSMKTLYRQNYPPWGGLLKDLWYMSIILANKIVVKHVNKDGSLRYYTKMVDS